MRFVFLGPGLCLQLPPHDASRRRTCCSATGPVTWTPEDLHLLVTSRSVFTSWLPAPRAASDVMPGTPHVTRLTPGVPWAPSHGHGEAVADTV